MTKKEGVVVNNERQIDELHRGMDWVVKDEEGRTTRSSRPCRVTSYCCSAVFGLRAAGVAFLSNFKFVGTTQRRNGLS